MTKKYIVELTSEERKQLLHLISSGAAPARKLTHARILLRADTSPEEAGETDVQISAALHVGASTVFRVRQRFTQEGLAGALERRPPNREYRRKLDGTQEAHLIALVCGTPPEGRARWTFRLLADRMVELEYVDQLSHETVRQTLKKTNLNRG